MLGKLFKYDLRSTRKPLLILYLCIFAFSLLNTVLLFVGNRMNQPADDLSVSSMVYSQFVIIMVIMNILALIVSIAATFIYVVYHFYRKCYSVEGYLTFTLPTTSVNVLTSKFLTGIFWLFINLVVVIVSGLMLLLFGTSSTETINTAAIDTIFNLFNLLRLEIGTVADILSLINLVTSGICTLLLAFFALTLGSIAAKRLKFLAGVGFYYVCSIGRSIISMIFSSVFLFSAVSVEEYSMNFTWYSMVSILLDIGLCVLFFLLTNHLMKKKLNLE